MILIAAAGKSGRWKNHLGVHKVMAPINGVPLIHRTIKQLGDNPLFGEIGVICYDDSFVIPPAMQFVPHNPSPLPSTGLGQSAEFWPPDDNVYLLLGDVCFTENAIKQIFMAVRDENAVTFFGHGRPRCEGNPELWRSTAGHHPELFAFSFPPQCQGSLLNAMNLADGWREQFRHEKARIPISGGWFTYRILNHLPVFMHIIGPNFIELDENVTDLDTPEDYERVKTTP
jgi:CTP:molybdopterin cytidylyltransferase MocA